MAKTVQTGWLSGSAIRQARKEYRCDYWRGKSNGGFCRKPITAGAFYVESGEGNGESTRNGVLLQDKYCLDCAGPEARASLSPAA